MSPSIDYSIAAFEALGIERIGRLPVDTLFSFIVDALSSKGFALVNDTPADRDSCLLRITDESQVRELARTCLGSDQDEMLWLASEFMHDFFVIATKHDLLFGFASTN